MGERESVVEYIGRGERERERERGGGGERERERVSSRVYMTGRECVSI